jgi:hypothetical protein
VIAVNLDTGERKSMIGSWGGGNMFTSTLVDAGSEMAELPANGAVIKGTMGYPRTYATIYAHPNALGRFLPAGEDDRDELTAEELQALYCFVCIKGGEYRREELRRRSVSDSTVDGLVSRGYLKRNRAGRHRRRQKHRPLLGRFTTAGKLLAPPCANASYRPLLEP